MSVNTLTKANGKQVGGHYYKQHFEFQVWDAWWLWKLDPFQANIIKYVVRFRSKDGKKDLQKAVHYLEKLIELEYGSESTPNRERRQTDLKRTKRRARRSRLPRNTRKSG